MKTNRRSSICGKYRQKNDKGQIETGKRLTGRGPIIFPTADILHEVLFGAQGKEKNKH
jgi:hypothetical protein